LAEKQLKRDYGELKETLNVKGEFDLVCYGENINYQLKYVQEKINNAEIKITSLKVKEAIISSIIDRTNDSVSKFLADHNYPKAQGLQNALITQFETYSLMQDMILKYESNIQSYIKMSLDIENHKVNTYVKIKASKKNDDKTDKNYDAIVSKFNEIMNSGPAGAQAFKSNIQKELNLEGY